MPQFHLMAMRVINLAERHRVRSFRAPGRGGQSRRRPRYRRHGDRSALSQSHAEQQRGRPHLRLPGGAQREVATAARARDRVEDDRSADVGIQAAQGRQVPRRQRLHGGRRRGVDRARADGAEQPVAVHGLHEADQGNRRRRSADDPLQDRDPVSADALGHDAGRDRVQGRREGDYRRFQHRQGGDRHRPLQARPLREGRSHRARAKRCVLGRQDAVGEGDAAPAAAGCLARRGAAVRRRAGHRERADLRRRGTQEGQAACRLSARSPTG